MADLTHKCGWTYSASDKYCGGCGERILKLSREFNKLKAEMDALRDLAADKPNPAVAQKFAGGFGPPPSPTGS